MQFSFKTAAAAVSAVFLTACASTAQPPSKAPDNNPEALPRDKNGCIVAEQDGKQQILSCPMWPQPKN